MKTVYVLIVLGSAAVVYSQTPCITPNGETGRCISAYECTVIIEALKNRTSETVRFIRESACGYKEDPLLCCGSVATFMQLSTSAPPVTVAPDTGEERSTSKPILQHRNLPLLPTRKICGVQLALDRIFFGNETSIDEFPWMALLEYQKRGRSVGYSCGGMLINERYVLTAAHCYVGEVQIAIGDLFRVRLGEYNISSAIDCENKGEFEDCAPAPIDVGIEEVIYHDNYLNNPNRLDDIAIIRLNRSVTYTDFVKPICLPLNGETTNFGQNLTVAGWGYTERNVTSPVKLKVQIPVMSHEQCKSIFRTRFNTLITDKQVCAGGKGRIDSCGGDSGGPLMRRFPNQTEWYAEGIVSYGAECGTDGVPGVYTRITEYMDWILSNMKP